MQLTPEQEKQVEMVRTVHQTFLETLQELLEEMERSGLREQDAIAAVLTGLTLVVGDATFAAVAEGSDRNRRIEGIAESFHRKSLEWAKSRFGDDVPELWEMPQ